MKKYTKKIMAMVTVAATMVTGTAIPVMEMMRRQFV